jgi:hypothetical protein
MRSCFQLSSDPAAGPPATDEIGARIGLPAIEAQQSDTTRWGGYTAEVGYATDEARIVVRTAHAASKTADDCIAAQRSNPGRLVITVLPRDAPDLNELRDRPEIVFLCTIATAEQLGALCNAESAIAFFKAAQKEAKV